MVSIGQKQQNSTQIKQPAHTSTKQNATECYP